MMFLDGHLQLDKATLAYGSGIQGQILEQRLEGFLQVEDPFLRFPECPDVNTWTAPIEL